MNKNSRKIEIGQIWKNTININAIGKISFFEKNPSSYYAKLIGLDNNIYSIQIDDIGYNMHINHWLFVKDQECKICLNNIKGN